MTIAQPANRLLLGFLLSSFVFLTACEVGNRPLRPDNTPVETSDFAYFGLLTAPNTPNRDDEVNLAHRFLNLDGNRISTAGFTDFNVPATVCTIDGCVEQTDAVPVGNGYAYFIANDANGNPAYSYSGILATTNLGEPLRQFPSPDAFWQGEWSLNGVGPDTADDDDNFTLRIRFNNRQFSGAGGKVIDGVYRRVSLFGNYSPAGVILNGQGHLTSSNIAHNVFLIGLVGSEGAVGAFRSADPDVSFAGGFMVTPPTR